MNVEYQLTAVREAVSVASNESRRIFATLVRLLGDFNIAEDVLQDAFAAAVERWPMYKCKERYSSVADFRWPIQSHRAGFADSQDLRLD